LKELKLDAFKLQALKKHCPARIARDQIGDRLYIEGLATHNWPSLEGNPNFVLDVLDAKRPKDEQKLLRKGIKEQQGQREKHGTSMT
jgi:hypothetical protein